jgi:hypothetical protein
MAVRSLISFSVHPFLARSERSRLPNVGWRDFMSIWSRQHTYGFYQVNR